MYSAAVDIQSQDLIRDIVEVDGILVPRYKLEGKNVLIFNLPCLGGTPGLPHSRYIQNFAKERGFAYVTFSWPDVECDERKINNMSVVRFLHQSDAVFEDVVREVAGRMRIILIGASAATTATLRIAHAHRISIDLVNLFSAGVEIDKHMVAPQYKGDSKAFMAQPDGQFKHLFYVPDYKPAFKQGIISCADLREAQRYELFSDKYSIQEYMPPIRIFAGGKDVQIPLTEQQKLCDRIRIRPGETMTRPEFTVIEDAEHLFTYEQMDPVGLKLQAAVESYGL